MKVWLEQSYGNQRVTPSYELIIAWPDDVTAELT